MPNFKKNGMRNRRESKLETSRLNVCTLTEWKGPPSAKRMQWHITSVYSSGTNDETKSFRNSLAPLVHAARRQ